MYRPLPIMFIASLLAATAAWAEPQGHDSRYPQQGGGRYERGAGDAGRAQSRPVERGEGRGPIGQVYSQRNWSAPQNREPAREPGRQGYAPNAGRGFEGRGNDARGNDTDRRYGGGTGIAPRYGVAPRDGAPRYGGRGDTGNVRPGNDRPAYNRPGNDRPGNDRPGNDRYDHDRYDRDRYDRYRDQGRDHPRYAGWTRGRDDWRDEHGRSWHHDRDWYQRYHYDHFRYYGNRFYARQRFSIGFYDAPWGYVPRVWVYGDRLPLSYYGYRYVIDDYYNYDLYAPPYATAWVRVGDDVLLVDLDTGEVLDVIANLFW